MRIISGKHRGRVLSSFTGKDIRPTADRAKEALFNIYKDRIAGSEFLDLCSGSGNVGIEAISRGAKVTMCDNSKESVALAKKNLAMIGEECDVVLADALFFLKTTGKVFDFIFIDPPYGSDVGEKALRVIGERGLISSDGVAVFESDREADAAADGLIFVKARRYGKAVFNIYSAVKNV